jgi:hypothetical protein
MWYWILRWLPTTTIFTSEYNIALPKISNFPWISIYLFIFLSCGLAFIIHGREEERKSCNNSHKTAIFSSIGIITVLFRNCEGRFNSKLEKGWRGGYNLTIL